MASDYRQAITEILTEEGIEYFEGGKNVSHGSINIQCPFCSDHSNHCGIFIDSMRFHCWLCGETGQFVKLLKEATHKSEHILRNLIREKTQEVDVEGIKEKVHSYHSADQRDVIEEISMKREVTWPELAKKIRKGYKYPFLNEWLKKRGYTKKVLQKHKCRICLSGFWGGRLLVPILIGNEIKGFVGVDVTGEKEVKYKMSDAVCKDYVYGLDSIEGDTIIIVEGILDQWRTEKNCVGTFGTEMTPAQKWLILSRKPKKLIISLDGDAYLKAKTRMVPLFKGLVEEIAVVKYPELHDPDSYGKKYGVEKLHRLIDEAEIID